MKTCVFTPSHTTGIRVAPIVPCVGSHATRLGHASAWLKAPAGPHFFRLLMVKRSLRALADRAAFVLRGTCTRPYRKCTY